MFYSPWYFWLLLLLPYLGWRMFSRRRTKAIRFSSLALTRQLFPTWRQRLTWLPPVLSLLTVLLLIVGLARPREGKERTVVEREGIAIEMIVDRSGSMRAMDFQVDGQSVDRLTAIKKVASRFINGGDDLPGRFSDLVGLLSFARYADGVTTPTLDHDFVVDQLNRLQIVDRQNEDGTAIGDAIALAVEKLNSISQRDNNAVQSRVIILLTDGENTAGELDPVVAAELAQTMGIKIYSIGVGTRGQAPVPVFDPFLGRQRIRMMPVRIDEQTLQEIAETTGGEYFRATDTDSLEQIYQQIDELEKTKVESEQFVDYRELAVQSFPTGWMTLPPILLVAFVLLTVRLVVQHSWLREVN